MKELTLAPSNSSSSSSSFTCNSSSTDKYTYDVFLSFRGEDTRNGFTGHLYKALCAAGIHTFIDDRLERGKEITPTLLEKIVKSRIANVDPSDVRHLRKSFEDSLVEHEKRFKGEVQNWRLALHKVANLSGWPFDKKRHGYEYVFVEKIVKEISRRINRTPLFVAKYPVGLKCRVEEVISRLDLGSIEEIVMAGIHGIGGIGKTTIACAVYNAIVVQYEDACFLSDVRERSDKHGLVELQEKLLAKLTGEKEIKVDYVRNRIQIIRSRLCQKRVLLILDYVNSREQLEALAGGVDWFGMGSRIIITTRDKHLLEVYGVNRNFEVKKLRFEEALELFCWNAFKKNEVDSRYASIINRAIKYCNGLPLALEIIGSNLFSKTPEKWESALDMYEKTPNKSIQDKLKLSYTTLEENEQEIFLDIACFFNGYNLSIVKSILLISCGDDPTYGIGVLEEKSLIRINEGCVKIHDLIAQMGREIVRSQSPSNPGNRSRLWSYKDILSVLEEDKGSDKIEFLMLNMPQNKKVQWNGEAFKKMENLKVLIIGNACFSCEPKYLPHSLRVLEWNNYSWSSLPSNFHPRSLGILKLWRSSLTAIKSFKNFQSLTQMDLGDSRFLKQVPDISEAVNLKYLNISGCKNLIEVHHSVGFLDKLERLYATGCTKLSTFPCSIKSASLEVLNLTGCFSLQSIPQKLKIIENHLIPNFFVSSSNFAPETLCLLAVSGDLQIRCGIEMLPKIENWNEGIQHCNKSSLDDQENVSSTMPVDLSFWRRCYTNIVSIYLSVWRPYYCNLTKLILQCCNLTDDFFYRLPWFPNIVDLYLSYNRFTVLPECMNGYHHLRTLRLDGCKDLREIKGIPPNIELFSTANCKSLTPESSEILLSEAFHDDRSREVIVPGFRIPKWMDHSCRGSSISFWFRNEFPRLVICFVGNTRVAPSHIHIFINGIEFHSNVLFWQYDWSHSETPCISMGGIHEWDKKFKKKLKKDEWNHVLISLDGGDINGMGVHVKKDEKGPNNVRFIDSKRCIINHDRDLISDFSLQNKFCPFLDLRVCDSIYSHKEAESLYHRLDNDEFSAESSKKEVRAGVKAIQIMLAPTKVKVFVLKILNECFSVQSSQLPTCCNLFKKKLVKSPMCPICETEFETIEHVFFKCSWTRPLWFASDLDWTIKDRWKALGLTCWLEQNFIDITKVHPYGKSVTGLMGNIFWAIWKARNEFVLQDKPVNPLEALKTAKAMHVKYFSDLHLEALMKAKELMAARASIDATHPENMKAVEVEYNVKPKRKILSINNNEIEPTCDKDNVKSAGVDYKVKPKRKIVSRSNAEKEHIFDKGTQVENKAKRKREEESSDNIQVEPNCRKGTHVENKTKRKRKGVTNDPKREPDCEKGTQVENKAKRKKGGESNGNTKREPNCNQAEGLVVPLDYISITNPKIQEISCNISRQDDGFGKNEEPNNEQLDSTSNKENPDLANLNIQLEVPICDIQPQGTTLDPKQPIPTETLPEECSTSLNDDEEEDPFAVLHSLVSADESISTSMSHIFEQESQPNSERASQIKQAVIILNDVLEQGLELLLSNQEDREKLELSLKILQSTTGEDALVTFDFKAFILQLSNQLPSMLENMSKSSDTEKAYQSLIRHKRSLAEFKGFGDQQKQQLADKRRACIEKVKANSNQILALRARILELQEELEQLEKAQLELEAAVNAVDIEERNLIQRAKDAVKDFMSTTKKLSGMEAERKAMIEVKNKTLIQWQNFRSIFDSSFKKL